MVVIYIQDTYLCRTIGKWKSENSEYANRLFCTKQSKLCTLLKFGGWLGNSGYNTVTFYRNKQRIIPGNILCSWDRLISPSISHLIVRISS